jgi:GntR family transcriptional regulator / MocR family aminotransferase
LSDQHSSPIDQATLARFITEGFFLSHIKRMRKIYAERRDFFIKQFNELLGDRFTLQIPEAGLNIVAWLKYEEDFAMIRRITLDIGVRPSTLSFFCIQAKLKPAFVFGFAAWTSTQIRQSLVKLASALRDSGRDLNYGRRPGPRPRTHPPELRDVISQNPQTIGIRFPQI